MILRAQLRFHEQQREKAEARFLAEADMYRAKHQEYQAESNRRYTDNLVAQKASNRQAKEVSDLRAALRLRLLVIDGPRNAH